MYPTNQCLRLVCALEALAAAVLQASSLKRILSHAQRSLCRIEAFASAST